MTRKVRPCGNHLCSSSSGICESATFGWGELSDLGYWEFPCRYCEDLWHLEELNSKVNEGRGIQTVHNIIKSLKNYQWGFARREWQLYGDKIPNYGEYVGLRKAIIILLGCRIHGAYYCKKTMCQTKVEKT